MDKDVYDDSFFSKNMTSDPAADSLEHIFRFHERLCTVLLGLERDISLEKPPNMFSRSRAEDGTQALYKIRQTFLEVFILLDGDRHQWGVLLCWRDCAAANKYTFEVGLDGVEAYDDRWGKISDDALVIRCSLQKAMHIVMFTDSDRKIERHGYSSEYLNSLFGEESEELDDWAELLGRIAKHQRDTKPRVRQGSSFRPNIVVPAGCQGTASKTARLARPELQQLRSAGMEAISDGLFRL